MEMVALVKDVKTKSHQFYLRRFSKMEQVQQRRGKLELFLIAAIGGCIMYYGAILLVSFGLWLNATALYAKHSFQAWVITWDSGPIEITLEQNGKEGGGIALANSKEVQSLAEAQDYLFLQAQDFGRCKARLEEILNLAKPE